MTAPPDPTLAPDRGGHNGRGVPSTAPSRTELDSRSWPALKRGSRTKSDLLEVDLGEGAMIVKDFARKPWWIRWFGRLQISREIRAYTRLRGVAGFPALVGRIDADALAIEKVTGHQLAFAPDRFTEAETHMRGLRGAVDRMHRAGVAHLDLRGRENVLVRDDGEIVIVDLGSAICLRPGGIPHRVFFGFLTMLDESAYLKWKLLLTPDRFTREEIRFLRRFRLLRPFWPINRKKAGGEESTS